MPKIVHWPSFLRELQATEQAWNASPVRYPREDAVPWLPFPIGQFVTLLTEAVAVAPPSGGAPMALEEPYGTVRFLDVGCGVGTKVRLAEALFGLSGYGIDIVSRFIAEARAHGVKALEKDAFDMPEKGAPMTTVALGYADFQIVYVNRPSSLQDELESLIMDRMAQDAVLIAVNWRHDPVESGWFTQYQEYGQPVMGMKAPVCGVWIKP
jgi:SAM-dependent methyltransferase